VADGSVYEPADLPCAEFPCRTIPSGLDGTFLNRPTRAFSVDGGLLEGQKKKRLAFGVNGDLSPALFKALYSLERNAQELGHLQLSFSQVVSNLGEFLFLHLGASRLLYHNVDHIIRYFLNLRADSYEPISCAWLSATTLAGLLLNSGGGGPALSRHLYLFRSSWVKAWMDPVEKPIEKDRQAHVKIDI